MLNRVPGNCIFVLHCTFSATLNTKYPTFLVEKTKNVGLIEIESGCLHFVSILFQDKMLVNLVASGGGCLCFAMQLFYNQQQQRQQRQKLIDLIYLKYLHI